MKFNGIMVFFRSSFLLFVAIFCSAKASQKDISRHFGAIRARDFAIKRAFTVFSKIFKSKHDSFRKSFKLNSFY
jgi:hypothetical protein